MRKPLLRKSHLLILFLTFLVFAAQAQNVLLDLNFQNATLPEGVTTSGTVNTSGSINLCTECSPGRIEVPLSGFLQVDIASCAVFNLRMKSAGSSSRTVTVKYKKASDTEYTTTGTVSVPQAGQLFLLATTFPQLVSTESISVRLENAASGGQFHINDLYVEGNSALSSAAEITTFIIPGQIGNAVINSAEGTIDINVSVGTILTSVVPSITLSANATIDPLPMVAQDFSNENEVSYTVTAQDGTTTKLWKVKVKEVASSEKEITAFKLSDAQIGDAVINSTAGTILVTMPDTEDVTQLAPVTLTLSSHATVDPPAGTQQNFSNPVTYTVTAQDNSTKTWTVTVNTVNPGAVYYSYQAEDAEYTGKVDSQHANFTGAGFIDFLAGGENYITFTVCQQQAGSQTAVFRYSMAKDEERKGSLYVNDVFIKLIDFPRTPLFSDWAEESATVSLQAGINIIKITWDETDGPNLDKLSLTGTPCPSYTLTISTTNNGKVSTTPVRANKKYFEGETVTLLGENRPDLVFENWSGDLTSTANPVQVIMNSDKSITGNFRMVNTYTLNVTKIGIGNVEFNPPGGQYAEGTVVTLTPQSVLGSTFEGWSGDLSGSNSPETITMNGNKTVTASFTSDMTIDFDRPVGFASVVTTQYPEFNGPTTGGMNSQDTLWINGPSEFDILATVLYDRIKAYKNKANNLSAKYAPLTIILKEGVYTGAGTSATTFGNDMLTVQEQGDLTIMGEKNVVLNFGINIKRSWNILIRNITFQDYYDDGINIGEPETHHIWIDHCTVGHPTTMPANTEHPDGGIDVKAGASYVTISWCNYRNSWKTGLVGHSDNNGAEDTGKLKVTYFGNYFYNTNSRNPRVRFGEVHVLNNLHERVMLYGIAASNGSQVYAENNFFLNTDWPMYADRAVADFKAVYGNNTDGTFTSKTGNYACVGLKQTGNEYDDSGLPVITAQINPAMLNPGGRSIKFDEHNAAGVFNPSNYYSYVAFPASVIRTIVPMFAGANKVDFFQPSTGGPGTGTIIATASLTAFSQLINEPSQVQSYFVQATGLTGNLTITPPVNYEISGDDGVTWFTNAAPLVLTHNAGTVALSAIKVRLNAPAPGTYNGDIVHTAAGANVTPVAVTGKTIDPNAIVSATLVNWPLTENNQDNQEIRHEGVEPGAQILHKLYLSNGTTVATVPSYSTLHGQAFGADPNGEGSWGTAAGGPGGTLNRTYYQQFSITAKTDYTVRVDSIRLNAAFQNTSSNTRFAIVYSKTGFTTSDSTNIAGGGKGPDGVLDGTAGAFATPILLKNRTTAGNPDTYRLALAGGTGVTLQAGETLTLRLYYSCGSSSTGRYAKLKDVHLIGDATQQNGSSPSINVAGTLSEFAQTIGTASVSQTYTVAGNNLTTGITITPPSSFEVSADGTTWFKNTSPLTITISSGAVSSTAIHVRLNATAAGTYSGTIAHTSEGASNATIAVLGTVTVPTPLVNTTGALTAFTQTVGSPSVIQTYTVAGNNLAGNVTIMPPPNFEVSSDNGVTWKNNASPLILAPSSGTLSSSIISVRLNAEVAGLYSGMINHTSTGITAVMVPVSGTTSGTVTSTSLLRESAFKISPNPVKDNLIIHHPENARGHISIYNVAGVKISTHPIEPALIKQHIDVADLAAGVYFIECKSKGVRVMLRMIKH